MSSFRQVGKFLLIVFIMPLVIISASKADVVPGEEHCVVNVPSWDRLNIRSRPSSKSRVVARKRYGSCGLIVMGKCRSEWCPIEDGHIRGWANRQFLSMVSPSLYCTVNETRRGNVNLRAFPSPESRVLGALNKYTCGIAFLPYSRSIWQKVRVNGWEGWVTRDEVSGQ